MNLPTPCAGNKPPRRNERRKARDRKRWPDRTGQAASLYAHAGLGKIWFVEFVDVSIGTGDSKPCYDFCKPKGPVCRNTFGSEVAAPTLKRGFVMSDFVRCWSSSIGMVTGEMGLSARTAARRNPCYEHLVHPPACRSVGRGF